MKIDQRLFSLLSIHQIETLVRKAASLEEDEDKVFHFVVGGFVYPVAVTALEIYSPFA